VLNDHLADRRLKVSSRDLGGITSSDLIVASEKIGTDAAYYVRDTQTGETDWSSDVSSVTAYYRHGRSRGANYLHLDGSVTDTGSLAFLRAFNPWGYGVVSSSVGGGSTTRPSGIPYTPPPSGGGGSNTRPG
jgi:prepilin-type processing-associated H-X9-DG protein